MQLARLILSNPCWLLVRVASSPIGLVWASEFCHNQLVLTGITQVVFDDRFLLKQILIGLHIYLFSLIFSSILLRLSSCLAHSFFLGP